MRKNIKFLTFLLTLVCIFSIYAQAVMAGDVTRDDKIDAKSDIKVLDLTGIDSKKYSGIDNNTISINQFAEKNLSELSDYKLIKINENDLTNIDSKAALQLIDNGTVFFIIGNKISYLQITNYLGIDEVPDNSETENKKVFKTGVFIYRLNNAYSLGTKTFSFSLVNDNEPFLETPVPDIEIQKRIYNDDNISSIIKTIDISSEKARILNNDNIDSEIVKTQLPSASSFYSPVPFTHDICQASWPYTKMGSTTTTFYVYDMARYKEDSIQKDLWHVVSDVVMDAEPSYKIKEFKYSNNTNCIVYGQTYIPDGTSHSMSLGGSVGFSGKEVSGSVSAETGWTYSSDSYDVLNNFPAGTYKSWTVTREDAQNDDSIELEPGIRIVNTSVSSNATVTGKFEEISMYWGIIQYTLLPEYQWSHTINFKR